ncbi:hypothetical protein ACP2AV_12030 [Aliiroseovarius sp. PTFE2010]|uniref:hypothetical protein n=1 Tax=Aliiroseovarius sp. PTFE2010 TaxID=3417190 RepID=UPI003CF21245
MAQIPTPPEAADRSSILAVAHKSFWRAATYLDQQIDQAHRSDPGDCPLITRQILDFDKNLTSVLDKIARVEAERNKDKGDQNGVQLDLDHAREDVQLRLALLAAHIGQDEVSG